MLKTGARGMQLAVQREIILRLGTPFVGESVLSFALVSLVQFAAECAAGINQSLGAIHYYVFSRLQ